jgi:hypothetical protein
MTDAQLQTVRTWMNEWRLAGWDTHEDGTRFLVHRENSWRKWARLERGAYWTLWTLRAGGGQDRHPFTSLDDALDFASEFLRDG